MLPHRFPSASVPALQEFPPFLQLQTLWMLGLYLLSLLPCLLPSTSCWLALTLHAADAAFTPVTCHQWPVIGHAWVYFLASLVIFSCNVYRLSHALRISFSQWILEHSCLCPFLCLLAVSFTSPFKRIQTCSRPYLRLLENSLVTFSDPRLWQYDTQISTSALILYCALIPIFRLVTGHFQIGDMTAAAATVRSTDLTVRPLKPASSSWLPVSLNYVTKCKVLWPSLTPFSPCLLSSNQVLSPPPSWCA